MTTAIVSICAAQGLAFIGCLVSFSYRAGRLLEKVENHEDRLDSLESWRNRSRHRADSKEAPNA